jgi:hypothetical protein
MDLKKDGKSLQKNFITICNEQLVDIIDIMIAGGFNARVSDQPIPNIIDINVEETINQNEKRLRDLIRFNNLRVMNMFYRHKEIHKIT